MDVYTTNGVEEMSSIDIKSTIYGTGASELGIEWSLQSTTKIGKIGPELHSSETLGVNEQPPRGLTQHSHRPAKVASTVLDKSLLERAKTLLEDYNITDAMQTTIDLGSLRGIVLQLWESAATSTQFHREILALLEAAVISLESPNEGQLSVLREAVIDLQNDVLAQAHIDVIRRQFINEGFSPLALLSEIENDENNNR